MCTIGLINNKILFKNSDRDYYSDIYVRKERDRKEVYCHVRKRPIAIFTNSGVGIVTAKVQGHIGIPLMGWIRDRLTDVKSAKDVVSILAHGPDFTSFNLIVADGKEGYAVEIWGRKRSVSKIKTAVRTNHYFDLKEGPSKLDDYPSSFIRYKRASELVKKASPYVKSAKKILKDHRNGPSQNSICRHGEINTRASMIMDLNSGKLYFVKGNPCRRKFKRPTQYQTVLA